jgi:hypothetical protein
MTHTEEKKYVQVWLQNIDTIKLFSRKISQVVTVTILCTPAASGEALPEPGPAAPSAGAGAGRPGGPGGPGRAGTAVTLSKLLCLALQEYSNAS